MTEIPFLQPLEAKLKTEGPLDIAAQEAAIMKRNLHDAGADMNIGSDAEHKLLFSPTFRDARDGRGIAVSAILGTDKTASLLVWSLQKGEVGGSGRIGGREGTQGRGLMQAAADLLAIAYFSDRPESAIPVEKILTRLNQRIRKGLERKFNGNLQELKSINERFSGISRPENEKFISSIPPGSLHELWQFLTTQ